MNNRSNGLTCPSRRGAIRSTFIVSIVLGAFVSGMILAMALIWLRLTDDPLLTDEALRQAQQRWSDNGPADYDMTIIVTGRQPGEIHVEVRGGVPTRVTRDHLELTKPDHMEPWTVLGMFDTVERDADNSADAAAGKGDFASEDHVENGSPIRQWASFHQQLGYPERYHRVIEGTPQEIRWEVTEFQTR